MTQAPRKRSLVRWPFLLLAAFGAAIVGACYWLSVTHPIASTGPVGSLSVLSGRQVHELHKFESHAEAWAILAGIVVVMLAIPGRAYRWGAILVLLALILGVIFLI